MCTQNPAGCRIVPVCEVLEKTFVIPSFQRGYRWDASQITALLEDLDEFQAQDRGRDAYYCLQPVVVVPEGENSGRFIVIDGQQRLTTIFLLLSYIHGTWKGKLPPSNLKLEFEGRPAQQEFMDQKKFSDEDDTSYLENIDNFYLKKAWESIKQWYESDNNFPKTLPTWELLTKKDKQHAAVIFYETAERDAVESFRRLNYGKIPLTSAEIIKALLLQSDCYPENQAMADLAVRRGVEWDRMERDLADPYLGGMLGLAAGDERSKMSLVLDFVAEDLNESLPVRVLDVRGKRGPEEVDLFAYHVINRFLREAPDRAAAVETVWREIQRIYNLIMNWRKNRFWYHLIGLYSLLYGYQGENLLRRLYRISKEAGNSKTAFERALKSRIGAKLRVPRRNSAGDVYPKDKQGLACPDLSYHGEYEDILRHILTAFNVWTVFRDPDKNRLFPFHIFRAKSPMTLEHIHPQSLAEDMVPKREDVKAWWRERKGSLALLPEDKRQGIAGAVKKLEKLLAVGDEFEPEEARKALRKIEAAFDREAAIGAADIHSLANLALLDTSANSASNANLMDKKRRILLERINAGMWIPPATEEVFAKKYSAGNIRNMEFWMPEDRTAYLEQINAILKAFPE